MWQTLRRMTPNDAPALENKMTKKADKTLAWWRSRVRLVLRLLFMLLTRLGLRRVGGKWLDRWYATAIVSALCGIGFDALSR